PTGIACALGIPAIKPKAPKTLARVPAAIHLFNMTALHPLDLVVLSNGAHAAARGRNEIWSNQPERASNSTFMLMNVCAHCCCNDYNMLTRRLARPAAHCDRRHAAENM